MEQSAIGQYIPVRTLAPPVPRNPASRDSNYWKSFKAVGTPDHIAGITSVDFCTSAPHDFAVTSSTRVTVYDGVTGQEKKVFSRFTDVAYSGRFRSDGQLLVAGGETGVVQVLDANSRTVLRQLKGHSRAVHWVQYSPLEKLHVLSASDDATVRWWDVATEKELLNFGEHTDYVRCGAPSPLTVHLWATGSYDHSVRLWDVRTPKNVLHIQHEKPLENVLFFPSGGLVATAGGNEVKIWDVIAGGKLLHVLGSHQKTVTSLVMTAPLRCGSTSSQPCPRLLTGSLDGHVKVFDIDTFKVSHSARYPHPILSMDFSPACTTLAVGMSTGLLHVRQRKQPAKAVAEDATSDKILVVAEIQPKRQKPLNPSNYRYFLRGYSEKASDEDYVVTTGRKPRLSEHDRYLKQFEYKEALNAALKSGEPKVVISVMEELVARSSLVSAISNRDSLDLALLLSFLAKHVVTPRYSSFLLPIVNKVLDVYRDGFGQCPSIRQIIRVFRENVVLELRFQEALHDLQGVIQPLLYPSHLDPELPSQSRVDPV